MKVQPSFYDDECAIVFSFYFDKAIGILVKLWCTHAKNQIKKNTAKII